MYVWVWVYVFLKDVVVYFGVSKILRYSGIPPLIAQPFFSAGHHKIVSSTSKHPRHAIPAISLLARRRLHEIFFPPPNGNNSTSGLCHTYSFLPHGLPSPPCRESPLPPKGSGPRDDGRVQGLWMCEGPRRGDPSQRSPIPAPPLDASRTTPPPSHSGSKTVHEVLPLSPFRSLPSKQSIRDIGITTIRDNRGRILG